MIPERLSAFAAKTPGLDMGLGFGVRGSTFHLGYLEFGRRCMKERLWPRQKVVDLLRKGLYPNHLNISTPCTEPGAPYTQPSKVH